MMQQEHNLHVQRETIHAGVKEAMTSLELKEGMSLSVVGLIMVPTVPKIPKFNIFTIQLKQLLVTGSQT